jgi:hypothetical protein
MPNIQTDERPREPGVVEQFVRDELEREKFLRMAGRHIGHVLAKAGSLIKN